MKIAIIAALPGELKPLVRHWKRVGAGVRGVGKWVLLTPADTWVAVCAGMGSDAAHRAWANATADGPVDMAISIGWAGALRPEIEPGTVQVPTGIIDAQTGEQFALTEGERQWRLVTSPQVADAQEKARLVATYPGAVLVDMEAATIARLASAHGIPFLAIKGVSDAANATLPDLNPFINAVGQMRMGAFLAHVASRPRFWPSLLHLGRNSARAAEAMRDLIQEFMKEKNVDKLIRTGHL